MMERMRFMIGQLLLIGVIISMSVVILGGIMYLIQHGHEIVNYQLFRSEPNEFKSIKNIFHNALIFSSLGLIQLGLAILVLIQLLRVALTTWMFVKLHDYSFVVISLFILFVLIYSTFWRF